MSTSRRLDPIALAIVRDLLESVAEDMAIVCRRTALSPNIKERADLSAALFDGRGRMIAHAAHIPVHLGAMPRSVEGILAAGLLERPGDVAATNDPYAGGSHLPDITLVAPVFAPRAQRASFHLAVRAHHADVGGAIPGSMAPQDDVLAEGFRIPPLCIARGGKLDSTFATLFAANVRGPEERLLDLGAQMACLAGGARRLEAIAGERGGWQRLERESVALLEHARRLVAQALHALPDGRASIVLPLDAPGRDGRPANIHLALNKAGALLQVDFAGTSAPVGGGLNAPRAVVESAVYHLLACLAPPGTPANAGLLACASISIPRDSLLDPTWPHPVAGGNVETSQRLVDALFLAAGEIWPHHMPAPGAGTMSGWTFGPVAGGPDFPTYYETIPAGAGGGPAGPGADAIQQHMTNTRSTPIEVFERRWPVRVERHAVRRGSGGAGLFRGGDGLVRHVRFLAPAHVALLMTRHDLPPPGANAGGAGLAGRAWLVAAGRRRRVAPRSTLFVAPGDLLCFETPGGGGWGAPHVERPAPTPVPRDQAVR